MPEHFFDPLPHDLPSEPPLPMDLETYMSNTQTHVFSGILSSEAMLQCFAQIHPEGGPVVASDLTGHICECCFDAMATVWVQATEQEDEHGRCTACADLLYSA